jgi:uncharacterized membrane protein YbhN (UPF0104 family)
MGSWKRIGRHLPAVLGVLLLIGAIYVVQKEFRHLRIDDVKQALAAIPHRALLLSFLWTVAAYGVLTFYDRLGTIYAGHPVSHAKAAFASFCAYALSHNLGFAAVSGAAVRYRLYAHWGLSPFEIAKVIAFCSLTFGLGGMVLGGGILLLEPHAVPFFGNRLPTLALHGVGLAMLAVVGAYITLSTITPRLRILGYPIELPHWRMALLQVLLATVDVGVTAAIFFALLPAVPGLSYARLLAVYLSSYTAGLVASLPGGLGVFDSAMLLGLSPYMAPPAIVGAILVFRLYYYIIPLFLAGSLFAGNEIFMRGRGLIRRSAPVAARPRWSEPDFAVAAGTGAVALCGFLLLSLGMLEPRTDYDWIDPDFAEVAAQAGQFLPSLIGAALIVLAFALSRRVNLAWAATIILLLIAAGVTLAKGEPDWIPAVLGLATLLVAPFRAAFYRHARLLSGPVQASVTLPLVVFVICVLALAVFERHVRWLDGNAFWEVILSPDVPNTLRVSVALSVALGAAALWRLVRPGRVNWLPWSAQAREQYALLGAEPPARADGLLWGEAERSAIAFRRAGTVLLALGDPAGAEGDRVSAVWRLRDLARQEGLDPAIWNAGSGLLKVYADIGLAAVPLGRDGMPMSARPVSEQAADPEQAAPGDRFLVCAAERDLNALIPLLRELSGGDARARREEPRAPRAPGWPVQLPPPSPR